MNDGIKVPMMYIEDYDEGLLTPGHLELKDAKGGAWLDLRDNAGMMLSVFVTDRDWDSIERWLWKGPPSRLVPEGEIDVSKLNDEQYMIRKKPSVCRDLVDLYNQGRMPLGMLKAVLKATCDYWNADEMEKEGTEKESERICRCIRSSRATTGRSCWQRSSRSSTIRD